jgi:glycosyltransferase involved in cell wall biosynthesis
VTRPIVVRNPLLPDPWGEGQHKAEETEETGLQITTVARLVEAKGLEYLLEAIVIVRLSHPDVKFRVYGDGPLCQALLERAASLDDNDAISMLSYELLNYEIELGYENSLKIDQLSDLLLNFHGGNKSKFLISSYSLTRAYVNYPNGRFKVALSEVIRVVTADFRLLLNRGVLSVLFHSICYLKKIE